MAFVTTFFQRFFFASRRSFNCFAFLPSPLSTAAACPKANPIVLWILNGPVIFKELASSITRIRRNGKKEGGKKLGKGKKAASGWCFIIFWLNFVEWCAHRNDIPEIRNELYISISKNTQIFAQMIIPLKWNFPRYMHERFKWHRRRPDFLSKVNTSFFRLN